ncbi:MAG: hypothetical protein P4L22_05570 [Candidatus Babeliales bacterium]|nr:hypothetical protein [Candidatus Babeliales bacterium]
MKKTILLFLMCISGSLLGYEERSNDIPLPSEESFINGQFLYVQNQELDIQIDEDILASPASTVEQKSNARHSLMFNYWFSMSQQKPERVLCLSQQVINEENVCKNANYFLAELSLKGMYRDTATGRYFLGEATLPNHYQQIPIDHDQATEYYQNYINESDNLNDRYNFIEDAYSKLNYIANLPVD